MDQRPDPRLDQRPHVTQQTTTSGATWGIAGAFFVFGGGADTDSPMTPATESTTPAEPAAPPATDAAPAAPATPPAADPAPAEPAPATPPTTTP